MNDKDTIKQLQDDVANLKTTIASYNSLLESTFATSRDNVSLLDVVVLYLKHHPDLKWDKELWRRISNDVVAMRAKHAQSLAKATEEFLKSVGLKYDEKSGTLVDAEAQKPIFFDVDIEA